MPSTVLIAPSQHLTALKGRADLQQTHTFADTEALKALELILRQVPARVVIERSFADTSRGTALITRIKADPALAACEIQVIAHGDAAWQTIGTSAGGATSGRIDAAAPSPAAPGPSAPLDHRGTRRASRVRIEDGVEVLLDGNPATLVDLSTAGAQVVSTAALRPNQRLRVVLQDAAPIRLQASVAWAAFEIPKTGPRYRAGVEFADADPKVLGRFIERHKR